jgi:outer membrane lipoprotein-sorting protein
MRHLQTSAKSLAVLASILAVAVLPARADENLGRELVRRTIEALPQVPFVAELTLMTPKGDRQLQLSQKLVDGDRKGYLEVIGPEDLKGIRHLFIEPQSGRPEQFLKLTASRSIVRVADAVRTQPFLGSTFYVADLVEPPIDEYEHKIIGEGEVGGRNCTLVESVATSTKEAVYAKIIVALDPKDLIPMRREFFDAEGKKIKVWTVNKVEKIDGFWTMMEQTMKNLEEDEESRIQVTKIKYNADLDDSVFTPDYLRR